MIPCRLFIYYVLYNLCMVLAFWVRGDITESVVEFNWSFNIVSQS